MPQPSTKTCTSGHIDLERTKTCTSETSGVDDKDADRSNRDTDSTQGNSSNIDCKDEDHATTSVDRETDNTTIPQPLVAIPLIRSAANHITAAAYITAGKATLADYLPAPAP